MRLLNYLIVGLALMMIASAERPIPPPPADRLPTDLDVLVIGDSNVEIGHITGELARIFEARYGYFGSGYHSLNDQVGNGSGYLPYLEIHNVGTWQKPGMVKPGMVIPYLAPDGAYAWSETSGAHTEVHFFGSRIHVYWLAGPDGGEMVASVDGGEAQTIATRAASHGVRRTTIADLEAGWHTLTIAVQAPRVSLLGVEAELPGHASRAVVHKWGKGWATTADFASVDPTIFAEALQLLAPEIAVILLGTNDHNLKGHNRDQFAANLRTIVGRLREAVPATRVLVVSTAQINSPWSSRGLDAYRAILPELCRQIGAAYWDMSGWFGPWQAEQMQDNVHVNQAGGARIAAELYKQILTLAEAPAPAIPTPTASTIVGAPLHAASVIRQTPGLVGWWSAAGQVDVDNEQRTRRWPNAADAEGDAVAPWAASQPTLVSGDRPVLRFDGKDDYLTFPLHHVQTLFAVFRAKHLILGHPYFNNRPFHPGVARRDKAFSANYAAKALVNGQAFLDGLAVHPVDDTDDALAFSADRLQVLSLVLAEPVEVGVIGWGGSWNFDRYLAGDLAELVIYNRALDDAERSRIEADLAARWDTEPTP